jgi:hypothetical protein
LVELDDTARAAAAIDVARSFALGCPTIVSVRTTGRDAAALAVAVGAGVLVRAGATGDEVVARAAGADETVLTRTGSSAVLQSSEKVGVPTRLIGAAVLGRAETSKSPDPDRARCFSAADEGGVLERATGNDPLEGERDDGSEELKPRRSESADVLVRDDGALARSADGAALSRDETGDVAVLERDDEDIALARSVSGAALSRDESDCARVPTRDVGDCALVRSVSAAALSRDKTDDAAVPARDDDDDDTLVLARAADDGAAGTLGLTRSERRLDADAGARSESASRRSAAATSPSPASEPDFRAGEDALVLTRSESGEVLGREDGSDALV